MPVKFTREKNQEEKEKEGKKRKRGNTIEKRRREKNDRKWITGKSEKENGGKNVAKSAFDVWFQEQSALVKSSEQKRTERNLNVGKNGGKSMGLHGIKKRETVLTELKNK